MSSAVSPSASPSINPNEMTLDEEIALGNYPTYGLEFEDIDERSWLQKLYDHSIKTMNNTEILERTSIVARRSIKASCTVSTLATLAGFVIWVTESHSNYSHILILVGGVPLGLGIAQCFSTLAYMED